MKDQIEKAHSIHNDGNSLQRNKQLNIIPHQTEKLQYGIRSLVCLVWFLSLCYDQSRPAEKLNGQ